MSQQLITEQHKKLVEYERDTEWKTELVDGRVVSENKDVDEKVTVLFDRLDIDFGACLPDPESEETDPALQEKRRRLYLDGQIG